MKLIDILVSGVLALMMLGVGSSLSFKDFGRIFVQPKALLVGLSMQMLVLPVMAFVLASLFNLSAEFKVGLIILAACPGGSTSNFISYIIGADTALSISMTSINSFITLISIPLIVNLALAQFMGDASAFSLPVLDTLLNIVFIVLLPAFLGVLLREWQPKWVARTERVVKAVNILLLGSVFAIKFFAGSKHGGVSWTAEEIWNILPSVLLLNVLAWFLGYFGARAFRLPNESALTVGIEVGLQNTTLALLVAGTLLQNDAMTKPALVYALFSFWTTLIFSYAMRRKGEALTGKDELVKTSEPVHQE